MEIFAFGYNTVSGGIYKKKMRRTIVAEYTTSGNCIWLDLAVTGEEGVDDSTKQQPIWRGYAILPEGQLKKRGAFDETQVIDIDEPRNLRKRPATIIKTNVTNTL